MRLWIEFISLIYLFNVLFLLISIDSKLNLFYSNFIARNDSNCVCTANGLLRARSIGCQQRTALSPLKGALSGFLLGTMCLNKENGLTFRERVVQRAWHRLRTGTWSQRKVTVAANIAMNVAMNITVNVAVRSVTHRSRAKWRPEFIWRSL